MEQDKAASRTASFSEFESDLPRLRAACDALLELLGDARWEGNTCVLERCRRRVSRPSSVKLPAADPCGESCPECSPRVRRLSPHAQRSQLHLRLPVFSQRGRQPGPSWGRKGPHRTRSDRELTNPPSVDLCRGAAKVTTPSCAGVRQVAIESCSCAAAWSDYRMVTFPTHMSPMPLRTRLCTAVS